MIALLRAFIIANLDLWQAGPYRYDEHGMLTASFIANLDTSSPPIARKSR